MKTLLSANNLERALLDQAKEKADHIFITGKNDIEALKKSARTQVDAEIAQLAANGNRRLAKLKSDMDRALPAKKRRLQGAFFEKEVRRTLIEIFKNLDDASLREILGKRMDKVLPIFQEQTVGITVFGMDERGLENWLQKWFPRGTVLEISDKVPVDPFDRGIEIKTADGALFFHASLQFFVEELLETRREELVRALFPELPYGC